MTRPAIAHIRLDAFRHNYRAAKAMHGGKALAVIKANAYGHGAVQCAKAIENEADGFAVACLEEAIELRKAGIKNPILLLEGFFEAAELPQIVEHDLWLVVHAQWQIDMLLQAELAKPVQVWLKMDTGMHRVGLAPSEYAQAFMRICQHQHVEKVVLMTHFANADNLNAKHTAEQVEIFKNTVAGLNSKAYRAEYSLANSAAILGWPIAQANWSRPGIMLYGANPLMPADSNLRAVMQLTAKIIAIRHIQTGESIGYGSLFTATRNTIVGVVACGYADGYPRAASNAAPAAVDGQMTKLIGRVSMDMLFVDLNDICDENVLPRAKVGSTVELWGDQVSANLVAQAAGTIAYELFCNVKRVQFQYSDS